VAAPAAAISGLSVSPSSAQIAVGQTVTVTPSVTRANAAVTLSSAYSTSNVAVASVNATTGVVTAIAPGTTTITVNVTGTGAGFTSTTLTGAASITVTSLPQGVTALNVQPNSLALALGSTAQLAASATQPTGAAAATITYGSTVPSVATVSTTGVVTAVTPGTAVITVTATSAANASFAAATLTQLVPVTVTPSANVTIQTITQGPIRSIAVSGSSTGDGILSEANAQVNQPIDITNVRDQIQVVINLQPNNQRVDSVVVFIANADGSARTAAARQLYSNGTANAGDITLFVNTADFTADFAAAVPSATTLYKNGQKIISASVYTTNGTTALELQNASNNRQTVNFNNLDGWTATYANPSRSATRITGTAGSTSAANLTGVNLTWWGGPGATGASSYAVAAVSYTPARQVSVFQTNMRAGVLSAPSVNVCVARRGGATGRNGAIPETFGAAASTVTGARVPYSGTLGAASGGGGFTATGANGAMECGDYELSAVDAVANTVNFPGVFAAVDNSNNAYPSVTIPNGYRTSSAVTAIVPNRLDYLGPSTSAATVSTYSNGSGTGTGLMNEPDLRRSVNLQTGVTTITGWVNGDFDINLNTAANSDFGIGQLAGAVAQRGVRQFFWYGCGRAIADAQSYNGTGAALDECAIDATGGNDQAASPTANVPTPSTPFPTGVIPGALSLRTRGPYQTFYTEADLLGNASTTARYADLQIDGYASARFGVDKTAPLIRWTPDGTDALTALAFGGQDTIVVTAASRTNALRVEYFDERAGFVDNLDLNNQVRLLNPPVSGTPSGTTTAINLTTTQNSAGGDAGLVGGGYAVQNYRSQQQFLSQAAGFLNQADFATRAVCLMPTNGTNNVLADPTLRQTNFLGFTRGDGNAVRATGADIVTNPSCILRNVDVLPGGPLGDGYRTGPFVSIPDAGMFRYSTRVVDRAGNISPVLTRWVALDAAGSLPAANLAAPLSVAQGGDENFQLSFEDRSEVRANHIQVAYPAPAIPAVPASTGRLVYNQQLLDARFNNTVNSPGSTSITTPNGAAFIASLEATNGAGQVISNALAPATGIDKATSARATVFDVVNNGLPIDATILGTALANPTNWASWIAVNPTRGFTSFTVLSTFAEGFNAGTGLKAQVVAPSNVINSPFTRVEFFRLQGGQWEYIGQSAQAIAGDGGSIRYWTYLLTTYANTPTSLNDVQRAAQTGDLIAAVGVRSTGEGLLTANTIGGAALNITVNGLPAGAPANVVVTNGAGFTLTANAAGVYPIPASAVGTTLFVTVNNTTFNFTNFAGTASPTNFMALAGLNNITVNYVPANTAIAITTTGLLGTAIGTYSIVGISPVSFTTSGPQANTTATFLVPFAGSYTVGSANPVVSPVTIGAFAYTVSAAQNVNVVAGGVPAPATITYTNTTPFINLVVNMPVGVTPSPNVTTTCPANPIVLTTATGTRQITTAAPAVCTTTAAAVQLGTTWYFPTITGINPANSIAAATLVGAPTTTVTYTAATAALVIRTASVGGVGNNLPAGIPFTVRVTSSAYVLTGGFQDFAGITGTGDQIVVPAVAGTVYNVSISRTLISGTQLWRIGGIPPIALVEPTDLTIVGGTVGVGFNLLVTPTGVNAVYQNIVPNGTPTIVTDIRPTITYIFTGPTAAP